MGLLALTAEALRERDARYAKTLQHVILGSNIIREIGVERRRQDEKWGEQNHPDGTSGEWETHANYFRRSADAAAKDGKLTWLHILIEEVYEAFAEVDPARLRVELIQVAAVAAAWAEAIDRRQVKSGG